MESFGIAKILALYFHAENVFDVYFVWKNPIPCGMFIIVCLNVKTFIVQI